MLLLVRHLLLVAMHLFLVASLFLAMASTLKAGSLDLKAQAAVSASVGVEYLGHAQCSKAKSVGTGRYSIAPLILCFFCWDVCVCASISSFL